MLFRCNSCGEIYRGQDLSVITHRDWWSRRLTNNDLDVKDKEEFTGVAKKFEND